MKSLLLSVLVIFNCLTAQAFVELGETYTGKHSIRANDFVLNEVPTDQPGYLGGEIANSAYNKFSRQFTVSEFSTANYLSVSGLLQPSNRVYEKSQNEYLGTLDKSLPPGEIAALLQAFTGPAQEMEVDFSIIKGSKPFLLDAPTYTPIPTTDVIAMGKYKFITNDSKFDKKFENILIPLSPFETPLAPNQDYWVKASTAQFNGTQLGVSTKLYGEVTTPEPATFLLLGGGLIAAFRRRGAKR